MVQKFIELDKKSPNSKGAEGTFLLLLLLFVVYLFIYLFLGIIFLFLIQNSLPGFELDQFWSAKFLEDFDDALSALARKSALRTIDVNNNGKMSLIEYVFWDF